MKSIWKSLTSWGKKYKDGSTGSFTKTKVNGKTKYVKTGSSPKPYKPKKPRKKH